MDESQPVPISKAEAKARLLRVARIASAVGFVGRVQYRHVVTDSGGAQFGLASSPENDLLVIYDKAFVRDADPEDFSLEAIVAHERGHQLAFRHTGLQRAFPGTMSDVEQEFLASVVGSLIVAGGKAHFDLMKKAAFDATAMGIALSDAESYAWQFRRFLETIL